MLIVMLSLFSVNAFSAPEDVAKLFKSELRDDVISYIKAEKEDYDKFAYIINTEFNKELVKVNKESYGTELVKNMDLTQTEIPKIKNIIMEFTKETSKKDSYVPIGYMKLEFEELEDTIIKKGQ